MTVTEYTPIDNTLVDINLSSLFELDIVNEGGRKHTDNENIFIIICFLSIIGIPIIIPFLCNIKTFDPLYRIIRTNKLYLPVYIFMYPIAIIYHILCIPLYPFINMLTRI